MVPVLYFSWVPKEGRKPGQAWKFPESWIKEHITPRFRTDRQGTQAGRWCRRIKHELLDNPTCSSHMFSHPADKHAIPRCLTTATSCWSVSLSHVPLITPLGRKSGEITRHRVRKPAPAARRGRRSCRVTNFGAVRRWRVPHREDKRRREKQAASRSRWVFRDQGERGERRDGLVICTTRPRHDEGNTE